MELMLARSLAGHDKDEIYVIVGRENDRALLANGKNRTLADPKRKKYKRLQTIKKLPKEVEDEAAGELTDLVIKRILKKYVSHISKEL